ncbi:Maf family protein [Rodentibacter caecimuris]|uniref:dTTP/UTP pyrophosphatase n=1 Tax=Rodentibacter caecimuris TaxID=1796644 RepID=A0ABX3KZQ8_9PAST|nr:septum formation protein Maf [Rodentibacter heylii]
MSKTIYLASNSPRRWALLQQLGINLIRVEGEVDETPYQNEEASAYCLRIALAKNQAAQAEHSRRSLANYPIVTADTTVSIHNQILGKPKDQDEAFQMLKLLSGKTHQVFTAVCVSYNQQQFSRLQTSDVIFKKITEEEIRAYIATGEPMDKAGAYGIQGLGGIFVQHLAGSFTGVMGLPIAETAELLKRCNLSLL